MTKDSRRGYDTLGRFDDWPEVTTPAGQAALKALTGAANALSDALVVRCPSGRCLYNALTSLEESLLWASRGLALGEAREVDGARDGVREALGRAVDADGHAGGSGAGGRRGGAA